MIPGHVGARITNIDKANPPSTATKRMNLADTIFASAIVTDAAWITIAALRDSLASSRTGGVIGFGCTGSGGSLGSGATSFRRSGMAVSVNLWTANVVLRFNRRLQHIDEVTKSVVTKAVGTAFV